MSALLSDVIRTSSGLTDLINVNGAGLTLWVMFDLLVLSSSFSFFPDLFAGREPELLELVPTLRMFSGSFNEVQRLVHHGRVVADLLVQLNDNNSSSNNNWVDSLSPENIKACALAVV